MKWRRYNYLLFGFCGIHNGDRGATIETGSGNGLSFRVATADSRMKLSYGWVIVAVGMVVGCIGMGGVMSFGVFLQPMADSLGWSRAGISTASTLAFLWMGVGGFFWGRVFDRYGPRMVVLLGGLLEGLGLVAASQAQTLPVFLMIFGTA